MIVVAGKQFKTINDEIYANDNKVMAAFADNRLVYPDYSYVGTQRAAIENIEFLGRWNYDSEGSGWEEEESGTYSVYADMFVYSNIPLVTYNDHLELDWLHASNGSTAVIRFKVTARVNGCHIPPDVINYYRYNSIPHVPDMTFYNPEYKLDNTSFYSYVFVTCIGSPYTFEVICDERCYTADYYFGLGFPYLNDFSRASHGNLGRVNFVFERTDCKLRSVTAESLQASRRQYGWYDSTVWQYVESDAHISILNHYNEGISGSYPIKRQLTFGNAVVEQISN